MKLRHKTCAKNGRSWTYPGFYSLKRSHCWHYQHFQHQYRWPGYKSGEHDILVRKNFNNCSHFVYEIFWQNPNYSNMSNRRIPNEWKFPKITKEQNNTKLDVYWIIYITIQLIWMTNKIGLNWKMDIKQIAYASPFRFESNEFFIIDTNDFPYLNCHIVMVNSSTCDFLNAWTLFEIVNMFWDNCCPNHSPKYLKL